MNTPNNFLKLFIFRGKQEWCKMRKTVKRKIIVLLVIAVYCSTAFSEQSASADAKFLNRIARKQASLSEMGQSPEDLRMAFGKYMKELDVSEDVSRAIDSARISSNGKYADRLEQKLTALIKDSVKDVDSMQQFLPSPVMVGTVTPESEDKLDQSKKGTK